MLFTPTITFFTHLFLLSAGWMVDVVVSILRPCSWEWYQGMAEQKDERHLGLGQKTVTSQTLVGLYLNYCIGEKESTFLNHCHIGVLFYNYLAYCRWLFLKKSGHYLFFPAKFLSQHKVREPTFPSSVTRRSKGLVVTAILSLGESLCEWEQGVQISERNGNES